MSERERERVRFEKEYMDREKGNIGELVSYAERKDLTRKVFIFLGRFKDIKRERGGRWESQKKWCLTGNVKNDTALSEQNPKIHDEKMKKNEGKLDNIKEAEGKKPIQNTLK